MLLILSKRLTFWGLLLGQKKDQIKVNVYSVFPKHTNKGGRFGFFQEETDPCSDNDHF